MIVKTDIFLPCHLLYKLKQSTRDCITLWIYSPFGILKKVVSDLFFFKKTSGCLTLYFVFQKRLLEKAATLTQVTLLRNSFIGLSRKHRVALRIKGVGFKVRIKPGETGRNLTLALGYSHLLTFKLPKGCSVALVGKKKLAFNGICYQELTQLVSYIQSFKSPDPYKGKGLNYKYKVKILKQGKKT